MKNLPDKIYLAATEEIQNLDNSFVGIAHSNPEDIVEPVEYIRKDAFIEKAEKYLTEKFINDVSVLAGGVVSINFDAAISNFVKYMKGE
jgi:hypothetical protein